MSNQNNRTFKPRGPKFNQVGAVAGKRMVVTTRTREVLNAARGRANVAPALNRRGVSSKDTGFVDLAAASYAIDTAGTITLVATVAQGPSVNQRIGKRAAWKSLQVRGQAFNGAAASVNDCAVIFVYDKRPTGALPAITDVLNTSSAISMNNDANSGRFSILKRLDFILSGTPATTMGEDCAKSMDFFLDLKKKPVVFKAAATGAIGDIEEGAIYMITVGSNAAGALAATLNVGIRTRFIDT